MAVPHFWSIRWTFALGCAAGLLACGSCGSPADRSDSTVPGTCSLDSPVVLAQKTDLLFVIDNSDSMSEEQEGVATELPAFISQLQQGSGVDQDFRVGVITTSVYQKAVVGPETFFREYSGQAGHLRPVPNDDGTFTDEKVLGSADPQLIEKFSRLVRQGTTGSGQETPFQAVHLAVNAPLASTPLTEGGNGGFLRDGARLLVVVVTDEDDCSEQVAPGGQPQVSIGQGSNVDWCGMKSNLLTPPETYFQALQALRDGTGAKRDVLWTAIGPVGRSTKEAKATLDGPQLRNVDCPTSNGPGLRQRQMAELFDPQLANLDSICKPSYRQTLLDIAAIATTNPTVEVMNVPDPALVQVRLTRGSGAEELCTVANGGVTVEPGDGERPTRLHFLGTCARRPDDASVKVRMLCVE